MRTYSLAAAAMAAAFVWADQAAAQTATQDIAISATVPNACTINNIGGVSATASTAVLGITTAGAVDVTSVTPTAIAGLTVACNSNATIQVSSIRGGAAIAGATVAQSSAGFQQVIDYQASAAWNGVTSNGNTATIGGAGVTASGTATTSTAGAHSGSLTVSITPTANSLPLAAGAYTDTLRVTLTP